MDNLGFATRCLHAGYEGDATHACAVPLHATNAYTFDNTEHARQLFALETGGNIYSRIMNPTCDVLEKRLSALEGGQAGVLAASGHAAMTMAFLTLAQAGDEIISARAIYGGAVSLLGKTLKLMGITVRFVDIHDLSAVAAQINDKTRAIFCETIGNPLADVPDIAALAEVAHKHGLPLVADNTIASPYLLRPFEHGADIVIHSTTKFLTGNGTCMGGAVLDAGSFNWKSNARFPAFNEPDASYHGVVYADLPCAFAVKLRTHILRDMGACQSAFNAWLTLLGVETLPLRMERHCRNAEAVVKFLQASDKVESVNYPTLASSPYRANAANYLPKGASSVFSFTLAGGREAAITFCDSLKMLKIVANLGDCRSMVNCPATTTHSQLSDSQLAEAGIAPGLIRISLGLEDAADILDDLKQALALV